MLISKVNDAFGLQLFVIVARVFIYVVSCLYANLGYIRKDIRDPQLLTSTLTALHFLIVFFAIVRSCHKATKSVSCLMILKFS